MNFYSYSPLRGMQYHPTSDEAKLSADTALKSYTAEDFDIPSQITWGKVTERATSSGDFNLILKRQDLLSYLAEYPQLKDGSKMENAFGDDIQIKNIKPKDLLINDTVLPIAVIWEELSAQIKRFKTYSLLEILAMADVLFELHGVKRGGSEGNMEFKMYNGLYKVTVGIQKSFCFGPEIHVARQKMIEALDCYPEEANDLKAMVTTAYTQIDGQLRVAEILRLRNLEINNPLWIEALDIIAKALEVKSSKRQLRLHKRNDSGGYDPIPLDIAAL